MADHSPAGGEALTLAETFNVYFLQVPTYHLIVEVLLVVYILRLLLSKTSDKPKEVKLTKEEEDELIAEWQPEPLIPKGYPGDHSVDDAPIVTGAPGTDIVVNGKKCLNLGTFNFLGFAGNQSVKDAAAKSVRKYGVGSCGPRGFYGTIDIHLDFEKKLAEFLHYEEAVLYSFGYATTSSAIPAYSTRNDTIFCDEGVCFAIQRGIEASRSKVKYFRHNDMDHLESLLEEKLQQEKKNPAKAKKTRKVIVVEGLYLNYGDLAPLPKLVELKKKYSTPLIIDESFSFGVLGGTGRGALEHFGLSSNDVDLNCISAEVSLASIGGLSCGKSHIVDRQRLSGQGYCFSASLPPLQAAAAIEALSIMDKSPEMFNQLRNNARRLRELLKGIKGIKVCGESFSPLIHLQLSDTMGSREQDDDVLQQIVDKCYDNGVIMVRSKYLENEYCMPPPSVMEGEEVPDTVPPLLLKFFRDIAAGMNYLANKGFVHRDLAARNVLLTEQDICKIADFGMSRDLDDQKYYFTSGGKIPVKWTAPEALQYRKYSTFSDVWSFGCVLYEMWSLGCKPFEETPLKEILSVINSGYRLPPPSGCPKLMYKLMIRCWHPDPNSRPAFILITKYLNKPDEDLLEISDGDIQLHGNVALSLGRPPSSPPSSSSPPDPSSYANLLYHELEVYR